MRPCACKAACVRQFARLVVHPRTKIGDRASNRLLCAMRQGYARLCRRSTHYLPGCEPVVQPSAGKLQAALVKRIW